MQWLCAVLSNTKWQTVNASAIRVTLSDPWEGSTLEAIHPMCLMIYMLDED